jgi:hypothetical protein
MLFFLKELHPHFYFKIHQIASKFSFEKKSTYEFVVDPLNLENARTDTLQVNRASIEFYYWDSIIEEDNTIKQKLFDKYELYRKVYELKNKKSYPLPAKLLIDKYSKLELFHALSVSTNTDQFLGEETSERREEMPEIKKHLSVLFSSKVIDYINASDVKLRSENYLMNK